MRGSILTILCFIILLGKISPVKAQWASEQLLTQKMELYRMGHPDTKIFVHFDKTIYTINETAWFTGYLLNTSLQNKNNHHVMAVALIRDIDSAIIKQDKYLMERGFSFGSMLLPDSLVTGNYHFQVSTDRVSKGIPDAIFIQPIVIKTSLDPPFNASIKLLKPSDSAKAINELAITVTTRDARFLPKPVEVSYKYGNIFKKVKTNPSGELILSLPEQENITDPNVYAKLKYGKDSSFINMVLPISKRKASVKFYPEGGNLINNIPCKIAWEVKDQQHAIVTLTASLYQDDKIINTIETNGYGVGVFVLIPKINSIYKVKLNHPGFADSSYLLPPILKDGLYLSILNAAASDTLILRLTNSQPQKLALRLHDFNQTYEYRELNLTGNYRALKIPLTDVPKGLKTITVFDSLGRPVAERMFFAHYNPEESMSITTDKPVYDRRQKVTLTLKLKDTVGFAGAVSIACVQNNRLPVKLTTDIESYNYLGSELSTLPMAPNGRGYSDRNYVEDMLLVKGWTRYTWQDIMNANASDTLKNYDTLTVKINITELGEPLKQSIALGFIKNTKTGFLVPNHNGDVEFKTADLIMKDGETMRVFTTGKQMKNYSLKINDSYANLNKAYVKSFPYVFASVPSTVENNSILSLQSNEKIIRLKEVQISRGGDNTTYRSWASTNECGDYVCSYGVLNCPNHPADFRNIPPVKGGMYIDPQSRARLPYEGCQNTNPNEFITKVPGIYTKKEFYVNDYAEPLEPAFISTLYWNHNVIISPKEQQLTFYTGDIVGKFRIVAQGITNNDEVIFGQQFFEVKAK